LRLDEFGLGGVTLLSVDEFVGDRTLTNAIDQFKDRGRRMPASMRRSKTHICTAKTVCVPRHCADAQESIRPWLIWIDDNPSNNTDLVSFAQCHNVSVFHFFSTASVKAWVNKNEGEMQRRHGDISLNLVMQLTFVDRTNAIGSASSQTIFVGKMKRPMVLP